MQFEKNAGRSLLISSVLLVLTMLLHPAGGSIEHLLKIIPLIIVTHSIAILSLPFCMIGFWGFTKKLGTENFLSLPAFAIAVFGLIAAMGAAMVNGLALPLFLERYKDAPADVLENIKPILKYGASLNHGFDYIFIGALCLSILLWSIAVLQTKKVTPFLGYFGIALTLLAVILLATGFVFVNLYGFRLFAFGIAGWLLWVSVVLMRGGTKN
jgi:hypothetical protein